MRADRNVRATLGTCVVAGNRSLFLDRASAWRFLFDPGALMLRSCTPPQPRRAFLVSYSAQSILNPQGGDWNRAVPFFRDGGRVRVRWCGIGIDSNTTVMKKRRPLYELFPGEVSIFLAKARKYGISSRMKTTLDIPDNIFRQAKARAALRGVSLRQFVTEAIEEKVSAPSSGRSGTTDPAWMQGFGALADLRDENRQVEANISEAFEHIDDEDRA